QNSAIFVISGCPAMVVHPLVSSCNTALEDESVRGLVSVGGAAQWWPVRVADSRHPHGSGAVVRRSHGRWASVPRRPWCPGSRESAGSSAAGADEKAGP